MGTATAEEAASERPLRTAVYAGVFDPPTLAHVEMIETARRLFDRLIVVVAVNPEKTGGMFTAEERVALLNEALDEHGIDNVNVEAYDGLVAPYAERLGACALVRGMRPVTDPDYEIALSLMNAKLAPGLPTVLLVAKSDHVYLSSSFVRQTAGMEGLIVPGTVPTAVERALRERFGRRAQYRAATASAEEAAGLRAPEAAV